MSLPPLVPSSDLAEASGLNQAVLGSSVHHLHLRLAACGADEDEAERVGGAPVGMLQAVAVGHVARLMDRQLSHQVFNLFIRGGWWGEREHLHSKTFKQGTHLGLVIGFS